MKKRYIHLIKDVVICMYYGIHGIKAIILWTTRNIFLTDREDSKINYNDLPVIKVGDIVEVDQRIDAPVAAEPMGSKIKFIPAGSIGWVVDIRSEKERPNSAASCLVLFPEGVYWVLEWWIKKIN